MRKSRFIFSLISFLVLTGCEKNNESTPNAQPGGETPSVEPAHEHTYSEDWSYDADYHWHAATCEHTNEKKDKEEHLFSYWVIDKEATEYETGNKHRICSVCDYREEEIIQKLNHTHKAGDPFEENRVEPDCTHTGSYDLVIKCSECGEEISRTSHTISALGHSYHFHEGKAATCTDYGWTEYVDCDRCSYTTIQYIPATGHQHLHTREENTHPATCTENGYYDLVTYCEDDNVVVSTERKVLQATGHNWGTPTYEWCFEGGVKCTASRVCLNDSEHIQSETRFASTSTTLEPTYETKGTGKYTVSFSNNAFETQIRDFEIPVKDKIKYTLRGGGTYYMASSDSQDISGEIVIPATHEGLPIKEVDDFFGCENITSVVIPDSVEIIGDNAFQSCKSLASVQLGSNIKEVGHYAFSECPITSMVFPNTVTDLRFGIFYKCENLKTVYIGENVKDLDSVLMFNTSIENLTLPFIGGTRTTDMFLCNIFGYSYSYSNTSVPQSLKNLAILGSCKSISNEALKDCNYIESLTLPFIGDGTANNEYLGYIFGATSVDENGAKVPSSLKKVTLSNACSKIGDKAFINCASIEEIHVGENIKSIGWRSFYGCSSVESLIIPESVTSIGNSAFGNMSSLLSVNILGEEISLGLSAFSGCGNLKSIKVPENNNNYSTSDELLLNKDKTRLICCPGGLEGVISIPSTVEEIEEYAFYSCSKVTSIVIPDTVTKIEDHVFTYCSSLESINIPEGIAKIEKYNFSYCSSLASISLPSTLKNIGVACFMECISLADVSLPNGLETISDGAFLKCTSIEEINVPDTVTSIGLAAFENCTSLKEFKMPTEIINLSQEIFSGCSSLKSVTLSNYDYGTVGQSAFFNCSSLEYIELPGITSIGKYAFVNCTSLAGIAFDECLTSIADYGLYNCSSLSEVYYMGTTSQWANVTKGNNWKTNVTVTTIVCSNGNTTF